MGRRRRKKDGTLFRGVLAASFLVFWIGLVGLGLLARSADRETRNLKTAAVSQQFDPSSNPEGFSLYAESVENEKSASPLPRGVRALVSDPAQTTALSNAPDPRRLVKRY